MPHSQKKGQGVLHLLISELKKKRPPLMVDEPTDGYTRYAYYVIGDPEVHYKYIYSDAKKPGLKDSMVALLFHAAFVCIGVVCLLSSAVDASPLPTDYDASVFIADDADVLSDAEEEALLERFGAFLEKTGVSMALVTVESDDWDEEEPHGYMIHSPEDYAHWFYWDTFEDDSHWLFVCSVDSATGARSWAQERGDDTEGVLYDAAGVFRDYFAFYRQPDQGYTAGGALAASVGVLLDLDYGGRRYKPDPLIIGAVLLAVAVCGLVAELVGIKKEMEKYGEVADSAVPAPKGTGEDRCRYCGGVYIHGVHESCPHCGAPIGVEDWPLPNLGS